MTHQDALALIQAVQGLGLVIAIIGLAMSLTIGISGAFRGR